jgi:hypothetical protein
MAVDVKPLPALLTTEQEDLGRRWLLVTLSALAGLVISILWSADLVDDVIGAGIADPLVGEGGSAEEVSITGSVMAAAFAFVTGVAGTFTACNIAVFGAIAPMAADKQTLTGRLREALKAVGWLALGAVVVAGIYGAIGVFIDTWVPQLSDTRIGDPEEGLRVRSIQSAIVFGLIGIALIWRGLAALKLVRWPLQGLFERHPRAELLFMGGLVGAFLIGRPFGMFRNMYAYAGDTNNPILGFLTFALQAVGNIVLVGVLFLALSFGTRGRFQGWLQAKPGRLAKFTAAALIVGGAFFVAYWDLRIGERANLWAWPTMWYNVD